MDHLEELKIFPKITTILILYFLMRFAFWATQFEPWKVLAEQVTAIEVLLYDE
jgi:hypothetical protein